MREAEDIREYLGDDGEFQYPVDPTIGLYPRRRIFQRRIALGCTVLGFFACALLLIPAGLGG
ncbi:MAG: hypothetical protein KC496_09320 [Anaerolineae bacterium]|nr:hypothetical protein [Anaerolineae bacterium]